MFEKRLFSLVPEAIGHIVASVACKWLALVANVVVMWVLAGLLDAAFAAGTGLTTTAAVQALSQGVTLSVLAAAIAVRAAAIYLAQRCGDRAAFVATHKIRGLVCAKLCELGPSYAETTTTAEAVQTSVEGVSQLQVYFGGYLPQLFYSALAPLTLFALLVWQAGLPATLLLMCVPVIPISIMMVMKNAKKIGEAYWGSCVDLGGMFLEAVQGLTTLKVYQADGAWRRPASRVVARASS